MARDLKEWMSDHEIQMEFCEELVWYLIFFATFFDAKMEYEEHKKKLRFIWKTLRLYGKDEFARECLCRLAADKKIWKLQDKKWVVMTKGFCLIPDCGKCKYRQRLRQESLFSKIRISCVF